MEKAKAKIRKTVIIHLNRYGYNSTALQRKRFNKRMIWAIGAAANELMSEGFSGVTIAEALNRNSASIYNARSEYLRTI